MERKKHIINDNDRSEHYRMKEKLKEKNIHAKKERKNEKKKYRIQE